MIIRLILFVLLYFSIIQCSHAENLKVENNDSWVIYLALDPYEASEISRAYHLGIDIKQYQYPLYVGYVYSPDSKIIYYKSFTPLVDKILKRWCEYASKGGFNVPGYDNYHNGDKDFIYAASINLQQFEGFVVIMRGIGVKPDDEWRPVFQQMFTINDDPDATSKKMNKIPKTYWPENTLPGHE
ncbi:hypothetical protein [Desulfomicrobium baculatum]|uniref:Uncharacterized protein n=1 Tax=Desulfomicrobium baculatum (strain DSM 4028 / VKM B-1378 / X) TaxID=525897 RepID=C7LTZ7_DESBD|nr:hypothetical protein [Desulfomicrobium baculatum]ACU89620.1 hypothetical protein Dbac_1527 [Desulfomicrobium baculatum DSM 4028]